MADVLHHHHAHIARDMHAAEVPSRVYWAAAIGLALLAALFAYAATTGSSTVPTALMEPHIPFVPFVPIL